jgi:hypothetical protein
VSAALAGYARCVRHTESGAVNPLDNKLESALELAVADPAHRPAFFATLLESTVYVLGRTEDGSPGDRTVETGEQLRIQPWLRDDGVPVIPFFSSLHALREAIDAESGYLALPARSLFEITLGDALVLNPGLDHGREFRPDEVRALLEANGA